MANPRIQHKRGPIAPTSGSGITAGEFAIQLGTGPLGPINVFVGVSGSTTPVRVGSSIVTDFTSVNDNNIPTTEAVAEYVGGQLSQAALGVCFMEGPAEGQGTIDIRQSLGGLGSGFSGFVGVTFQLSFAKSTTPKLPGDGGQSETDSFGANHLHRTLVGDAGDGFNPKRLTLGNFLGYIGYCGGDVTVDQYGKATITGLLGANNGGLGFTALGLTYGEIPIWMESGWTAARINGATGISVINSVNGITLSLKPLDTDPSGNYGNVTDPVQVVSFSVDQYGRITSVTEANLDLYKVSGGFTGYVTGVFDNIFSAGSSVIRLDGIQTDHDGTNLILTNSGITGIQVNGTYYTGGIILSAGSGISLAASGSNPETITISNTGVVGASGYISFQGHTQGNVHLANLTGSNNLVFIKGGFRDGFDVNTGTCGYAVFVGLSSGVELPSNIPSASNAFISIPTGFTGWGGRGGACFGAQVVSGGTGGARGYLEVNRIQATGNNKISGWPANSIAGTVLELHARGGTEAGRNNNSTDDGRNAKIVLASFPSDQWNPIADINGNYSSSGIATAYQIGGPNRTNALPGLNLTTNVNDIETGTVRLYKNARVEKHLVVGGNVYVLGNYFDNQGATVDFTKIAYIANNYFLGSCGSQGFINPAGSTFGYGIITLGASGLSASDSGILYNFKRGNGGPTAAFFGIDGSSGAFVARIATSVNGITGASGQGGELNLATSATTFAPLFVGAINGIGLEQHTTNTPSSIIVAGGHRLGLCGAFGLTFSVSANNTVVIPSEATQPTTLVTLTTTQTMTNKTLGQDCIIDCGTY